MLTQSTFKHSIWRGFMALVAFSIPLILFSMPVEWQSMTIGTFLMVIGHYAEGKLI